MKSRRPTTATGTAPRWYHSSTIFSNHGIRQIQQHPTASNARGPRRRRGGRVPFSCRRHSRQVRHRGTRHPPEGQPDIRPSQCSPASRRSPPATGTRATSAAKTPTAESQSFSAPQRPTYPASRPHGTQPALTTWSFVQWSVFAKASALPRIRSSTAPWWPSSPSFPGRRPISRPRQLPIGGSRVLTWRRRPPPVSGPSHRGGLGHRLRPGVH